MTQQLANTDSFSADNMEQLSRTATNGGVCVCDYVFCDSIYIPSVTPMTGRTIQLDSGIRMIIKELLSHFT